MPISSVVHLRRRTGWSGQFFLLQNDIQTTAVPPDPQIAPRCWQKKFHQVGVCLKKKYFDLHVGRVHRTRRTIKVCGALRERSLQAPVPCLPAACLPQAGEYHQWQGKTTQSAVIPQSGIPRKNTREGFFNGLNLRVVTQSVYHLGMIVDLWMY